MWWLPPWPLHHKLVEFAIAFALVLGLARFLGGPGSRNGHAKR